MKNNAGEMADFLSVGGNPDNPHAFAGHLADRLSALEQNLCSARRSSDVGQMDQIRAEMADIRRQAREAGLRSSDYPGLFR